MSPMGAPMADIRQVKFVGATGKANKVLAGYVLTGKDMSGTDAIVGFVLDLENGQIVGVNGCKTRPFDRRRLRRHPRRCNPG